MKRWEISGSKPPEAFEPLRRIARLLRRPLDRFFEIEAASGIVLIAAAALALVWANSPWASTYDALWNTAIGFHFGPYSFERSLAWFVNDGLMTIFFFVAGMEIRREIHDGELSDLKRAALPLVAALGGMLVPAGIYLLFAREPSAHAGWGVPTATDIAFAMGVLALLGKRVPATLRLLLLTLAVADDLGAILVIAIFYSKGVSVVGLGIAAVGMGVIALMRLFGVRTHLTYVAPAIVVWAGIYASGVHPTVAGVVVGLMTPVTRWLGADGFKEDALRHLESLEKTHLEGGTSREIEVSLRRIDAVRREALSPAEHLIEKLHPYVAFGIMPVFALANAGVTLEGRAFETSSIAVAAAIAAGLVIGKPLGILAASLLAVRVGLARMPRGITPRHLLVLGTVAGLGFTMSLFIAQLAFDGSALLDGAKLGVLAGSAVAAIVGLSLGRALLPNDGDGAKL